MGRLVFLLLLLATAGHANAAWCVCKQGLSESVLQKALDYACGAGADCTQIKQNGACFNPNTVLAHCSFAVNSYFQKKGQTSGSCDFAGAAAVSPSDPSTTGCVYPASASATSGTPVTVTPGSNTPGSNTPGSNTPGSNTPTTNTNTNTPLGGSPYVTTPGNGVLGGVGPGLGPSGVGINTDDSYAGFTLQQAFNMFSSLAALLVTMLVFLWG